MFRKSLHAAGRFGAALALSAALAACATAQPPLAAGEFGRAVHGAEAAQHIETFDTLDFEVFSHQRWDRLHESHTENIIVSWPDGHDTTGIEIHTRDLQQMFLPAPDTKIEIHPIRVAVGEWTAVTGVMTGTFTQPLRLADGTVIQPTGRSFRVPMSTFGHWTNGRMDHEWLYWDNQTYMRQLGLSQ